MKDSETIKKEREEYKIMFEERKAQSKERLEKLKKKSDEMVGKAENISRSGWENMSDKQANIYNLFTKWVLRITAVMLILLAIVFPPCIIISIAFFYISSRFDAKHIKKDYKGNKSFILCSVGVMATAISLALPPVIILAVIAFVGAYKEKKKNEN